MKAKHVWWSATALVVAAAVGGTAALGVTLQREYGDLSHGEAQAVEAPEEPLSAAEPGEADLDALSAKLDELAKNKDLATFGGEVIDTETGDVVWQRDADKRLTPASSTKVLTTAAATLALDENEKITTKVYRGSNEKNVVIKAAGDVWMTHEQLDDLAEQISKNVEQVDGVYVDTSVWSGEAQAPGWDPENVDGGFVAPMEPAMLYGGRLGATTGDVPRSHEPALDVAKQLGDRLGAGKVGMGSVAENAQEVASVDSPPLADRAREMVRHSDNVMAEAIARELAMSRGKEASFEGDTQATLEVLREQGFDVEGVDIKDNSGLSVDNRLTAGLLTQLINGAVKDPRLRPLVSYLPVAGGDGTLYERYGDSAAKGYVRAKTGTLTGVSALAGTAQGDSGRVYAFAFLVNDGDILAARKAQDALASALHEF
ncbi:D-alanyl-D-alanine carboxypeptidase/D-alanyl-D-alanine-endopeptidase [Corynebacterium kefirresidentii]|uniref:D-alanyl-D-alanine carboxypeptidase/D-alanyl-D-alanine endopeptidase n=1 Tax=Corynebacterium TaxID=1716 RepID=UPI001EF21F6E|nr:D-alanyl-D-alanine carboxypeptidase/D-alanyl-D-alanine-endopeptidase [Corynebacterium kefirresidentii]MCG7240886.1 D-alanyl-D-alanine carboxypeptidase/D-alanyl-D-alanine-endopeptidase [Corynebacterium kefirresidentii]MCG7283324.1 D-alanyl-D-alanine carboxypeptidase/D-alanyl-D-alanine-endopeptidase [Corynebacterium kefirresidentii]MDV2414810.1 D-alanyl-D-alanine carboxypeptidase/D-alanyl-D-alanine-endopeptidase [Corynebacterium kefirresidentii]